MFEARHAREKKLLRACFIQNHEQVFPCGARSATWRASAVRSAQNRFIIMSMAFSALRAVRFGSVVAPSADTKCAEQTLKKI
jgi:hypothetical protein